MERVADKKVMRYRTFILATFLFALPLSHAAAPCATLLYDTKAWLELVNGNPKLKAHADKIFGFYLSGKLRTPEMELEVALLLRDLRDEGMLRPVLTKVLAEAKKQPAFPPLPGTDAEVVEQVYGMIDAELIGRETFRSWTEVSANQIRAVELSGKSEIGSSGFLDEFSSLTKSAFTESNHVRSIHEASEAVSERVRMIQGAKKSIRLMTWAMYGDHAGELFADLLIRKFNEGVDVKIIVDGLTSSRIGYRESVAKLKAAGVPVLEWRGKTNPYFGQHRKFMIVDAETGAGEVIAGGRNLGDVYLHLGTKPGSQKWRDTDVLYKGPAVRENEIRFAEIWNEQTTDIKMSKAKAHTAQLKVSNGMGMAVLDHTPNADGFDPIYLGILKSISGAKKTIDIANSYVILTPALREAILKARARGVRVRIFTNSGKSVDEPIVSNPILRSMSELLPHGVEIYLKQGDTLHSKYMIVDDELSWVMSYNLHPRSLRYEGETANVISDAQFAEEMRSVYEADLKEARRAKKIEDLGISKSAFSDIAEKNFRDQL